MIDHRHAALDRGIEQRRNLGIAHLRDAHETQHDAGHGEVGLWNLERFHVSTGVEELGLCATFHAPHKTRADTASGASGLYR